MSRHIVLYRRFIDCLFLAWKDFTVPYRRTFIGPFWEILSAIIWIAGLSLVFYSPNQFNSRLDFVSYVACGIVSYGFVAQILTSTPTLFTGSSGVLMNLKVSPMFLVYRRVLLNFLRYLAAMVAAIGAVIVFGPGFSLVSLFYFFGITLSVIAAIWMTTILAIIGARFHDLAHITSSISRVMLFMSPVFWAPGGNSIREIIVIYNPIYYFLEVMRAPLLGQVPAMKVYLIVVVINLLGCLSALWIYKVFRHRMRNWI